jgi:hypothetical protein
VNGCGLEFESRRVVGGVLDFGFLVLVFHGSLLFESRLWKMEILFASGFLRCPVTVASSSNNGYRRAFPLQGYPTFTYLT